MQTLSSSTCGASWTNWAFLHVWNSYKPQGHNKPIRHAQFVACLSGSTPMSSFASASGKAGKTAPWPHADTHSLNPVNMRVREALFDVSGRFSGLKGLGFRNTQRGTIQTLPQDIPRLPIHRLQTSASERTGLVRRHIRLGQWFCLLRRLIGIQSSPICRMLTASLPIMNKNSANALGPACRQTRP